MVSTAKHYIVTSGMEMEEIVPVAALSLSHTTLIESECVMIIKMAQKVSKKLQHFTLFTISPLSCRSRLEKLAKIFSFLRFLSPFAAASDIAFTKVSTTCRTRKDRDRDTYPLFW